MSVYADALFRDMLFSEAEWDCEVVEPTAHTPVRPSQLRAARITNLRVEARDLERP